MCRRKIQEIICKIGMDKLVHFFCSAFLTIALGHFFHWGIAAGITLALGVAKELSDSYVDKKDLIADALGVLLGALILII